MTGNKARELMGVTALTVAVAFGLTMGVAHAELGEVEVGGQMPDFTMPIHGQAEDDDPVTLSELEGKVVVLDVRCHHCPWIRGADVQYREVVEEYGGDNVVFYGIDPHNPTGEGFATTTEQVLEYNEDAGINWPVLIDIDHEYSDTIGATRTPEVYIVDNRDADNMMTLVYHGAVDNRVSPNEPGDENYVAMALDDLLAGEPVQMARVNAWGCTINR